MEDIFRYDDRPASLDYHPPSITIPTISQSAQQHDINKAEPNLEQKAKKREYAKGQYAKKKALNPNLCKIKHQRYLSRLSSKTKEEKEAIHARRLENNRINYHRRKQQTGYGRNLSLIIKQIKQKIDNNTANPEERAKYKDFMDRKRIASKKYREKTKALKAKLKRGD